VGVEYNHIDLGEASTTLNESFPDPTFASFADIYPRLEVIRATLDFKFGAPPARTAQIGFSKRSLPEPRQFKVESRRWALVTGGIEVPQQPALHRRHANHAGAWDGNSIDDGTIQHSALDLPAITTLATLCHPLLPENCSGIPSSVFIKSGKTSS
jgi:hypothetical protein